MGEVVKGRLDKLAEEINREHNDFRKAFKSSYRSALRAGDLLNDAKAEVGHGKWTAWVKENCEFSMRTAQVYMRIANHREQVEEALKNAEPAYLSIEGVLMQIASPPNAELTIEKAQGPITRETRQVPITIETSEVREKRGVIEELEARGIPVPPMPSGPTPAEAAWLTLDKLTRLQKTVEPREVAHAHPRGAVETYLEDLEQLWKWTRAVYFEVLARVESGQG